MQSDLKKEVEQTIKEDELKWAPFGIRLSNTLAIFAFIGFAFIDPLLTKNNLSIIHTTRFITVLLLVLLSSITFFKNLIPYGLLWSKLSALTIGTSVILITALIGSRSDNHYHEELAITILAYGSSLPSTIRSNLFLSFFLITLYNLCLYILNSTPPTPVLIANNAALITSSILSLIILGLRISRKKNEITLSIKLKNAHNQLKDLIESKDVFFANISHELRTPLTLIVAATESVLEQKDNLTTSQIQQIDITHKNSIRLLRLVDDLLELSRLKSSSIKFKINKFAINLLIGEIVKQSKTLAQRKDIRLDFIDINEPLYIEADIYQIERILLNLIANSIKFTHPKGSITLKLIKEENNVRIEVADTGIGIPQDAIPYIFDRFYQVENVSKKRLPGVGIGLSLCQNIVILHGGKIEVHSLENQGTTFSFTLPYRSQIPEKLLETSKTIEVINGLKNGANAGLGEWHDFIRQGDAYKFSKIDDASERRVLPRDYSETNKYSLLIVEDNPDIVAMMGTILGTEYKIYVARDGEEGLGLAQKYFPNLIISDIMMPKKDGFELLTDLKRDPQLKSTPVILLTARGQAEDRILANQAGADAYLPKPFHTSELKSTIEKLLKKQTDESHSILDERALALRVMSEGIAHDILNPVSFVKNSLSILNDLIVRALKVGPSDTKERQIIEQEAEDFFKAGESGVNRITEAVKHLRRFTKGEGDAPFFPTYINEPLERVCQVLHSQVIIEKNFKSTSIVAIRPGDLEQVFLNIMINAQQASLPEKCLITVETFDIIEASQVYIKIKDNGPGIQRKHLKRIFDPYFTTKSMGTGLGLSICRRIVQEHSGELKVESEEGQGSVFVIMLPISNEKRFFSK